MEYRDIKAGDVFMCSRYGHTTIYLQSTAKTSLRWIENTLGYWKHRCARPPKSLLKENVSKSHIFIGNISREEIKNITKK